MGKPTAPGDYYVVKSAFPVSVRGPAFEKWKAGGFSHSLLCKRVGGPDPRHDYWLPV
jgi:hypothetical protein